MTFPDLPLCSAISTKSAEQDENSKSAALSHSGEILQKNLTIIIHFFTMPSSYFDNINGRIFQKLYHFFPFLSAKSSIISFKIILDQRNIMLNRNVAAHLKVP